MVIIFNSFPQLVCPRPIHHQPNTRHLGQTGIKTSISHIIIHPLFQYRDVYFYEYFASNQLDAGFFFAHLSLFLFSNHHQSSVQQLKTHMGIDFRPEPCGLNSKERLSEESARGLERESEGKKERKKDRREDGNLPKRASDKNKLLL